MASWTERRAARRSLAIEEARLALFDLDEGELPVENESAWVPVAWPVSTPFPGADQHFPDRAPFLTPEELETIGPTDRLEGRISLRLQDCVVLLTTRRLLVRPMPGGAWSMVRNRYRPYASPTMAQREILLTGITEVGFTAGDPIVVAVPGLRAPSKMERTVAWWIRIEGHAEGGQSAVQGPRWPNMDAGTTPYLAEWSGIRSGIALGLTPLSWPPASHAGSCFALALARSGVWVHGEAWEATMEMTEVLSGWAPLTERLATLREILST